jgi:hypothetical protein
MAARFISGVERVDVKKDIFWNSLAGDDEDQVLLETCWVTVESLDRKDFNEVSPSTRCRLLRILIERIIGTVLFKRIIDVSGEANIRITG